MALHARGADAAYELLVVGNGGEAKGGLEGEVAVELGAGVPVAVPLDGGLAAIDDAGFEGYEGAEDLEGGGGDAWGVDAWVSIGPIGLRFQVVEAEGAVEAGCQDGFGSGREFDGVRLREGGCEQAVKRGGERKDEASGGRHGRAWIFGWTGILTACSGRTEVLLDGCDLLFGEGFGFGAVLPVACFNFSIPRWRSCFLW